MAGKSLTVDAVNTIQWIREATSIAIPVYQRDYRWTWESSHRLLADIEAVALQKDPDATHFIGSILTVDRDTVTLVDGQQRLITVFLLLLAIKDSAHDDDPPVAESIGKLLLTESGSGPRLQAHENQMDVLRRLIVDGADTVDTTEGGALLENYIQFTRAIAGGWRNAWTGLNRLENVVIRLNEQANAQQVFESLNSTGESLVNHELMHNYVLMGLTHGEQIQVEHDIWSRIEAATTQAPERFWRDYLILNSDTMPDLQGEQGLYRAFKEKYPRLGHDLVRKSGESWVKHAQWYEVLLDPEMALDADVRKHLGYVRDHFPGLSPLILGLYRNLAEGKLSAALFVEAAELVQAMALRRALVGLSTGLDLASTLCRTLTGEPNDLIEAVAKRMPEDPQVRLALRLSLPLASYVLRRLQRVGSLDGFHVEHIYPQTPNDHWTGDGIRTWGKMSEAEKAEYKIALPTIGNLTLLEAGLNQSASNKSFADKKDSYLKSKVGWVKQALATRDIWDKDAIDARTEELSRQVIATWARPAGFPGSEEEQLIRVVDLPRPARRDMFKDQFEFARLGERQLGAIMGVQDLWLFIAQELWRTRREEFLAYATTTEPDWPFIRDHKVPHGAWSPLDGGFFVFWGWAYQYLLEVMQNVIQEFDLDNAVRVKLREVDVLE